jgi:hypothetical protein
VSGSDRRIAYERRAAALRFFRTYFTDHDAALALLADRWALDAATIGRIDVLLADGDDRVHEAVIRLLGVARPQRYGTDAFVAGNLNGIWGRFTQPDPA